MQVQYAHRHFHAEHERFHQHAVAERERGLERFAEVAAVHHRRYADRRPLAQRFDDHAIAERGERFATRIGNGRAFGKHPFGHIGSPMRRKMALARLCPWRKRWHARRCLHKETENLEIALNGAVFARRTVQHWKYYVGAKLL
jgi:hypothetical protein